MRRFWHDAHEVCNVGIITDSIIKRQPLELMNWDWKIGSSFTTRKSSNCLKITK